MTAATMEAGAAYEAAHRAAIVVARTDRVQLRAIGRDPVRMVQGLVTNDLAGAPEGRAVYAAMLTPKGRMIADLRIVRRADGSLLLDLHGDALEGALAHLRRMVPPLFARFEPTEPQLAVVGAYGPDAASMLARAGIAGDAAGAHEDDVVAGAFDGADVLTIGSREAGVPGFDLFIDAARGDALRARLVELGATPASLATVDLLRIEAGRPAWGAELDPERIPLEADLLERAISTSKGCYTGQEVIIRILHRGHVNWHLRGLLLGESAPPARGTELATEPGGRAVGRITSAVRSPALGQTIALGYVRREVEVGSMLYDAGGAAARVSALPFERTATP